MNSASRSHDYECYAPHAYDNRRGRGSRKLKRYALYAACLVALWLAFNMTYNSMYKPYMKFWDDRIDLVEQSREYLTNPDGLCAQASKSKLRVKIPEYDQCRVAERRLRSSPALDAFTDLMEYLQFCAGGECMVFSVNVFSYIGWLFWGFVLVGALIVLAVGATVASICYRNLQAGYALPLHADPVQYAAGKRAPSGVNHHGQFDYPPPAHIDLGALARTLAGNQQHTKQQ
jgi:hypothetical protein